MDMITDINEEVVSERRIFRVGVTGILIDLRKKHHAFPGLVDPNNYTFTNSLGAYLFDKGQKALLVKSARCDDGINIAAFTPDILRNPRHHSYPAYRWTPGTSEIKVQRADGKLWKKVMVKISDMQQSYSDGQLKKTSYQIPIQKVSFL
jgi:hypothetical protein